jgi:hypothetical protein
LILLYFSGEIRVRIMDEEKIRKELEAVSNDDEDYLRDLDEEFCDLSSEAEDSLRKRSSDVSTTEPASKKKKSQNLSRTIICHI